MRILLAANASYSPPRGGATRSNLAWLNRLAAAGHECRVVAAELRGEDIHPGPIPVLAAAEPHRRNRLLREQIAGFRPDWVLVSSEDLGQLLLREACQSAPGRVVYLAHTPQLFPFGPASWNPNPEGTGLLRRCAGIVAIGSHTAGYIERHLGRRPIVIHPPIYGPGPFEKHGSFDRGWVTMINPCGLKGISIFLALARKMPGVSFAALAGWGTTAADRRALEALPNVTLLDSVDEIGQVLSHTRVLLMPSLWLEGFGLSVMEALLGGIPVVSSDSGGLVEAKLGTRFLLPVRPIERYEPVFDEHGLASAVIPDQDLDPWAEALNALLTDRAIYEEESETSRQRALQFVSEIRPQAMGEYLASLSPRRKILLAQNSSYFPSHGGGDKSNRLLMEALAERGHDCRVVARLGSGGSRRGVTVNVVGDHPNIRAHFADQIAEFQPDLILASTDDPAQLLLEAALWAGKPRVVFLSRTTLALPFGPDCAFPSPVKADTLRRVNGIVAVSEYVARYMRQWGGLDAVHVPISLLEPGPYAWLGRPDNEFVTLVNPCAVKGISIFLALADRMPEVAFAAVPTWGTTRQDLEALRRRANVHLLDPVDDIDQLFSRTRVLLVPSLWAEARSRIIPEAMLRGVPVLASDTGGIPEATLGVDYLLPVRAIEKYRPDVDERMVPVAEVPVQDVDPWHAALSKVLCDREHYQQLSQRARERALAYAASLSVVPFENYVEEVLRSPRTVCSFQVLSPDKRTLLGLRLRRERLASQPWFPSAGSKPAAAMRLFCFPYAGAGTAAFRGWSEALPSEVEVCPARLPGRESRLIEAPLRRMEPLVRALADAILPYLNRPFAFFGHSMGAAIAFELARLLRSENHPQPVALLVSGARAPQFRLRYTPSPEPSDEDLLKELEIHPDLVPVVLPALRADTALYRKYIYADEPPLDCPIMAFGGIDDPHVTRGHLAAWEEQTIGSFTLQMFPGGHFFLETARPELLAALSRLWPGAPGAIR